MQDAKVEDLSRPYWQVEADQWVAVRGELGYTDDPKQGPADYGCLAQAWKLTSKYRQLDVDSDWSATRAGSEERSSTWNPWARRMFPGEKESRMEHASV